MELNFVRPRRRWFPRRVEGFGARRSALVGAILGFAWSTPGVAHTVGLSLADFSVQPDGAVEARLTFATAEPLGGLPLDRDHDGLITPEDVAAARDDLRAFLLQGIEVDADHAACPATFRDAVLVEADGLVLEASFACPDDATEIEATLFYLSALPRGHREVARIAAGENTVSELLTGDHRAIALRLRPERHGAVRKGSRAPIVLVLAAALAGLLFWGGRKWRAQQPAPKR